MPEHMAGANPTCALRRFGGSVLSMQGRRPAELLPVVPGVPVK